MRGRWVSMVAILALLLGACGQSAGGIMPFSSPEPSTCLGKTAAEWTAAGYAVVVGTDQPNTLNASWRKSVVIGLGGNDTINGGTSDDVLCGGDGDDVLSGGGGINWMVGGPGNDLLTGGPRRDMQIGGGLVDGGPATPPAEPTRPAGWFEGIAPHLPDPWEGRIYAFGKVFDCQDGDGNDVLTEGPGGAGEESNVPTRMWGCDGDDEINEGDGDGYLWGGRGFDTLIGGPGNDWLSGGEDEDWCDGGLHQGAVNGVWAAVDSAYDGTCEVAIGIP